MSDEFTLAGDRSGIPHLEEWLGLWAIQEQYLLSGWQALLSLDLAEHLQTQQRLAEERAEEQRLYPVTKDGIALIEMRGPLMKHVPSMTRGTSTVLARRKLRAVRQDSEVAGVLMVWESPGGTVNGNYELASDIEALAKEKPVWGQIEDLCASAAFYSACQCSKLFSNAPAMVGSIGTYGVIVDTSARAAEMKVKVHVVKAGEFKGLGVPGTEITEKQLAVLQEEVNDRNEHFLEAVARGRRLSIQRVRELADGKAYIAAKAKELGLVDGVQSLEATLSQLAAFSAKPKKGKAMSESTTATPAAENKPLAATVQPATVSQLEAACKGADEKFILGQLKLGATLEAAKDAWLAEMQSRLAAQQKELEKAQHAASNPAPGVDPVTAGTAEGKGTDATASGEEAIEAFNEAVTEEMTRSKCERHVAHARICRTRPELREAMIAAHNEKYPQARQTKR